MPGIFLVSEICAVNHFPRIHFMPFTVLRSCIYSQQLTDFSLMSREIRQDTKYIREGIQGLQLSQNCL